jgi:NAD(P)-dependent dehydrogenase (short-subunit alcohol dehydrogenase family)
LAKAGHKVYAGVRSPDTADNLKAAIAEQDGAISLLEIDVTDEASIKNAIGNVLSAEGRIDVLVNNAGIGGGGSVEEVPMDRVRKIFETNFFGLVAVTQAVLPGMRERSSGAIINVSSLAGQVVLAPQSVYSPSKFAVESFSEILAQQMLPFNVRVAIIEPGVIATSIFENSQKAQEPPDPNSPYAAHGRRLMALFTTQMMHRTPTPADVAAQVIEQAITTDDPKLRYLVGQDAEDMLAARRRISDEDYIKFAAIEDDEEFYDAMKDWLGKEYFRP